MKRESLMTEIQSDIVSTSDNSLIAFDIGNSRIKVLINDEFYSFKNSDNWKCYLVNLLENSENVKIAGYSSVNSVIETEFLDIMSNYSHIDLIRPKELINNQKFIKFGHINGIGYDRMFGLIGAVYYNEPALITVDCGTAITVNAVDDEGICRGGAIFAGLYTQIKSLNTHTDNLKNIIIEEDEIGFGIGKNTTQAMSLGVLASSIGGISYLVNKIKLNELNRKNVPIYITGGYAKLLINHLNNEFETYNYKEHLVLDGILTLMS